MKGQEMLAKEKLISIIQQRGKCDGIECIIHEEACPFAKVFGKYCNDTSTPTYKGRYEVRYLKAIELFVQQYGEDNLLEILL